MHRVHTALRHPDGLGRRPQVRAESFRARGAVPGSERPRLWTLMLGVFSNSARHRSPHLTDLARRFAAADSDRRFGRLSDHFVDGVVQRAGV